MGVSKKWNKYILFLILSIHSEFYLFASQNETKLISTSFSYAFRKDLSNQNTNDKSIHEVSVEPQILYFEKENYTLAGSFGLNIQYYAENKNIVNERGNPMINDLEFGNHFNYSFNNLNQLMISLIEGLPTSEESQSEGVKSSLTAFVKWISLFNDNIISISPELINTYIFQTYKESYDNKSINIDNVFQSALTLSIKMTSNFKINFSLRNKIIHQMNDENILETSTAESITYNLGTYQISLTHINGSDKENETYRIYKQDEMKKIFKLGLQFEI